MNNANRVAIFVDAENLTQWIKQDGLETLLKELSSIGTVVVRKAYARWTNTNLAAHQSTLNRLGFELIHTFHPVSGKNSADIQMAVDVTYCGNKPRACLSHSPVLGERRSGRVSTGSFLVSASFLKSWQRLVNVKRQSAS